MAALPPLDSIWQQTWNIAFGPVKIREYTANPNIIKVEFVNNPGHFTLIQRGYLTNQIQQAPNNIVMAPQGGRRRSSKRKASRKNRKASKKASRKNRK